MSISCPNSPIPGLFGKYKMRSFDKKLSVPKIPFREPEHPIREMSADRRRKLEKLKSDDLERNRLDRVGKIILRKLALKLGTIYKDVIKVAVDETLQPGIIFTENLITEIESKAKLDIAAFYRGKEEIGTQSVLEFDGPVAEAPTESTDELPPPVGGEWSLLQAFSQIKFADDEREKQDMLRQKKLKFRESLEEQMRISKEFKERQKDDNKDYMAAVIRNQQQFHEAETKKKEAARMKNEEEMKFRLKQIEENSERRKKEDEQARAAEQHSIHLSMKKLQMDNHLREEVRLKKIEELQRVKRENDETRRRKLEEKARDKAMSQELIRKYSANEARDLAEREAIAKRRMDCADAVARRSMEARIAVENERKLQEDQLRLESVQQKAAEVAKEEAKEIEKRQRAEKYKFENDKMREWHERMVEKERRESEEERQKNQSFAVEYEMTNAENLRRKKAFQAQYRESLLTQMKSKRDLSWSQTGFGSTMDPREREYNYTALKTAIAEVPVLVAKLQGRRPRSAAGPYGDLGNSGGSIW